MLDWGAVLSRILPLLAILVCTPIATNAQTVPPIRSKVVLVPLDVRVLDREGNPVTDLSAADFTVYEDDVRQEIAHFVRVPLTGERIQPGGGELAAAATTHRTFILVLGSGEINAPGKGLDGLIDFVKNRLSPTDRVGLTAYLRTSEPSTDHAAVLRFLERYKHDYQSLYDRIRWDGRPRDGVLGPLTPETRRVIDAVFSTPGIPVFSDLPGVPGSLASRYSTYNYARWTIQHARRIPGEKQVVVLAAERLPGVGGRVFKENPNAHIYVKMANEARVALSYINTGGVTIPTAGGQSARYPPSGRLPRIEPEDFYAPTDHRAVAERTGGIASFYRYANHALDRIERGSRFQYLLGYYPAATHAPDVHRTVRIEVNRRDVTAQHRHGYRLAPSVDDEQEFRATAAEYRLTTELARLLEPPPRHPAGLRSLPTLRVTTERVATQEGSLKVGLAFNPARVSFDGEGDDKRVVLEIAVVLDDHKGNPIGELTKSMELTLSAKELARAKDRWIEFDVMVPFAGEPARIRAVIYDYDRDGIRSAVSPVRSRR